jgi:small-conductance mechanosensitive channel
MLCLGLLMAPAWAAAAAPATTADTSTALPNISLSAEQAREALLVLRDPRRRAQLEDTLQAIAAAGALSAPAPGAPSGLAALAPGAIRPNGLVSDLVRQAAQWAAQSGHSLRRSIAALLDTSSMRAWWRDLWQDPMQRAASGRIARSLCGALLPALALTWLAHWLLSLWRGRSIGAQSRDPGSAASVALLRRLPRAALNLLFNLLPLGAFVIAASIMVSILSESDGAPDRALDALIDIYVISRGVVIMGRFLLQPEDPSLRLVPIGDHWARYAQRWIVLIVSVMAAGLVVAETALSLGLGTEAYLALLKVVALIGHLMLALLILQCRTPVAVHIRASLARRKSLAMLGGALADSWAFFAAFAVMALWFVWALDVRNGYRVLLHLGGASIAILILARLVSIVTLGALARLFHVQEDPAHGSLLQQHAYRYYPLLRRLLSWAIALLTALLLLQVWGANVPEWFQSGTVTHRLSSTLITLAVAITLALFAWEWINVTAERRLDHWTQANDLARAARLRTLLPMLRAALVLAIAPVAVLTVLSDLGVNIAPLVAGASIFGVALGFGSQKLVQDFITGIFLLMDNTMQVGDAVTLAGVSGTVEHFSIRTVRLRGGDGSVYTIPFSSVSTVNNSSRGLGNAAVRVNVAYGQDIDRAIATLKEIGTALRHDPQFKDGILSDFSFWGVDQLDGAAVTLSGQIECLDSARWGVQREFNRRILDLFRARGIEIANPQRSVLLPGAPAPAGSPASVQPLRSSGGAAAT